MKANAIFVAFALLSCSFMPPKKRILFFGDSITQQGAEKGGYIQQLDSLLAAQNRAGQFELIGAGVSGNKVYDLYLRLETDVLEKKPDAVFIYVGINDVWHKSLLGTGTDPDKFVGFYAAMVKKLKQAGCRVFLCTPSVIGERRDGSNPLDSELNHYAGLVRELAKSTKSGLVDLRQRFLRELQNTNTANADRGLLTTDGVHLNYRGNAVVAEAMLAVLQTEFTN